MPKSGRARTGEEGLGELADRRRGRSLWDTFGRRRGEELLLARPAQRSAAELPITGALTRSRTLRPSGAVRVYRTQEAKERAQEILP